MSSRGLLVFALVAGVAAPEVAEGKPASSRTLHKASKSKATSKTKKKKKRQKKKRKKVVARTPSRATLRNVSNMPRGYAWPPSKQMLAVEKICQQQLTAAGVAWQPAKTEGRIVAPLTIDAAADGALMLGGIKYTSAYRKGPHKLDCQLALALEEVGKDLHAAGVREIKFGSIFRWTNVRVNGETRPFLSRHALGIAMDIVSFFDATGREANVKTDYPAGDPLLLAVETTVGASGRFRTVLTPKNDPVSHADHFHIEVAVDYTAAR